MKLLKEMAWKLPVGLLWYIAAGFPFKHLPFWQGLIAWFIFYLALDLIRWGLKREKEPTDTSAYRQHVYVFMADEDGELIMERCTFAMLVMIVAGGNVEDFLKTCDQETRNEYGRILDAQKAVPVGILFNRPNWEGTK